MTIAACYLSPEGLVFGADSTTTYTLQSAPRHYNFGQKIFEIGEGGTLAVVTWGLGGLPHASYRTLLAELADSLDVQAAATVKEVAERWVDHFWDAYQDAWASDIARITALAKKSQFQTHNPAGDANTRSLPEEFYFQKNKENLVVGFCLGGYVKGDRRPYAYQIIVDPLVGKPVPEMIPPAQSFWGVPALITRLISGCADEIVAAIVGSGKWNGSSADLEALIAPHKLVHPTSVPIREAIDFTHACLLTTIKAMKFSNLPQVCGGPIELAVVTTDRAFRWVRHKPWESAIREGDHHGV